MRIHPYPDGILQPVNGYYNFYFILFGDLNIFKLPLHIFTLYLDFFFMASVKFQTCQTYQTSNMVTLRYDCNGVVHSFLVIHGCKKCWWFGCGVVYLLCFIHQFKCVNLF